MKFRLLTLLICFFTMSASIMATQPVNLASEDATNFELVQNDSNNGFIHNTVSWVKSKVQKAKLFVAKKLLAIDITDSSQMLRYWLICWAIGLLLSIVGWFTFGLLSYIGYLFWLVGSVCAVLWLVSIL